MAGLGFKGLAAMKQKVDLEKLRIEKKLTQHITERVKLIFTDIVMHTPQFSSNLVYNWYIEYGRYTGESYVEHPQHSSEGTTRQAYLRMGGAPYQKGDDPAVSFVLGREFSKLAGLQETVRGKIRWNSKVYFVNTAPYADEVDQNLGPLDGEIRRDFRPANLFYGKTYMMARAKMRYPELK